MLTDDYHSQVNSFNFEKWMKHQVIPNLPLQSVLNIDNDPYYREQEDKVSNKSHTKKLWVKNTRKFLMRE